MNPARGYGSAATRHFAVFGTLLLASCGKAAVPPAPPPAIVPRDMAGPPLARVRAAVEAIAARGDTPIVVFDLDGTIFDNAPRNLAILRDFAASYRENPRAARKILDDLDETDVEYHIDDTLRNVGIVDSDVSRAAWDYWEDHFFTDTAALADRPMPGAVEYVRDLHEAGAFIVYLTGRDEPGMGQGTRQCLEEAGFPIGVAGTLLLMKPESRMDDTRFKKRTCEDLRRMGVVVAEFENKVPNAKMFRRAFPEAVHVFIETPRDEAHPAPGAGIEVVPDFTEGGSA